MDCVDKFLRLNSGKAKEPFGGNRWFYWRPLSTSPVVKTKRKGDFKTWYDTPYFLGSCFQNLPFEFIELEKIFRQKDEIFIEILNAIRNGTATEELLAVLNQRYKPDYVPPEGEFYIYLTTLNRLANEINEEQLARIPGLAYDLTGTIEGDFDERDLPTEKTISLKIGAQVMLLNNDPYGQWVNGSVGKVVEIEKDKSGEVKTVVVELRDGEEVYVEPFTWEIFEYQYDEKSASIKTIL